MRRLRYLVYRYGETNERNEFKFSFDLRWLVSQIEMYDQAWIARGHWGVVDEDGVALGKRHSAEADENMAVSLEKDTVLRRLNWSSVLWLS